MRVQLQQAAIGRGLGAAVPALDLVVDGPVPVVVSVQTDERPLLVSMLLAGRIRSDSGRVLIDGREDADELRRRWNVEVRGDNGRSRRDAHRAVIVRLGVEHVPSRIVRDAHQRIVRRRFQLIAEGCGL